MKMRHILSTIRVESVDSTLVNYHKLPHSPWLTLQAVGFGEFSFFHTFSQSKSVIFLACVSNVRKFIHEARVKLNVGDPKVFIPPAPEGHVL